MPLRLYNSLTKREEDVAPLPKSAEQLARWKDDKAIPADVDSANIITLYTCGPTVYGRPHIGNYASFLMADLLRRWLEAGHGYHVVHAKNITDVGHLVKDADSGEDKIEKQAREEYGQVTFESVIGIARKYELQYLDDEATLGFLPPAYRPRATAFIRDMAAMVEALLASGHAYVLSDGIYFDVTSAAQTPYGTLSGNTLDGLQSGARIAIHEGKRYPADFALWKFCVGINEHHALRWPSPKGEGVPAVEGFPGWHIECSAMSRALLGDQIDLHTGGEDNIFPHHECEIAQSEACTGKTPFVGLWLHKRRIDLEGEKMSKSLGNVLSIPDIVQKGYSPQDIRYYLLSVHYRTNLKFSWKGMDDAKKARKKIVEWMQEIVGISHKERDDGSQADDAKKIAARFTEAMDADLNTSSALSVIFDMISWERSARPHSPGAMSAVLDFLQMIRRTFGCFEPEQTDIVIPPEVQALVDARAAARASKNFAEADRLRMEIEKERFTVRDSPSGESMVAPMEGRAGE